MDRNSVATETASTPRIEIDLTDSTFDFRKQLYYWNKLNAVVQACATTKISQEEKDDFYEQYMQFWKGFLKMTLRSWWMI